MPERNEGAPNTGQLFLCPWSALEGTQHVGGQFLTTATVIRKRQFPDSNSSIGDTEEHPQYAEVFHLDTHDVAACLDSGEELLGEIELSLDTVQIAGYPASLSTATRT